MEERLTFSAEGPLAAAIRAAAQAAGLPPAAWVGRLIAAELGAAGGGPAGSAGPPGPPGSGEKAGAPVSSRVTPESLQDPAAWQLVTDEAGMFTVGLPVGWANRAWSEQGRNSRVSLVTSTSPDGSVRFRSGDSSLVTFVEPLAALFTLGTGFVPRKRMTAEQFGTQWLAESYRGRSGLAVLGYRDDSGIQQIVTTLAQRAGAQVAWCTAGLIEFSYHEAGAVVNGVLAVSTLGFSNLWVPQVHVVEVRGGPAGPWVPALAAVGGSISQTAAAQAQAAQSRAVMQMQHENQMANLEANRQQMIVGHNQRMNDIQTSGMAHQARMADMRQTWDNQNASWQAQQQSQDAAHGQYMNTMRQGAMGVPGGGGDVQHDQFINMLREERTVTDSQGYEHQVADGADRYYYNQHKEQWIGLQEHQDIADYTDRPEDWQQGTITR